MTDVLDLWRWIEPGAGLVSGSVARLERPVRGVVRTRTAPPHLPEVAAGQLLVVDDGVLGGASLDALLVVVAEAALDPAALWVVGAGGRGLESVDEALPVLVGELPAAEVERRAAAHLERMREDLATFATALRLAAAEAALADPQPSAPAGVLAGRLRRGVAVGVGGDLVSLNPRPAGRTLATRFAALFARLPADRARATAARRSADGLWILERPVGPTATAWLFDDLPFAAVDQVALDSLAVTLRALLRRPAGPARAPREPRLPPSTGDPVRDTLIAVARANGRVARAARSLGVHRNTVLYRLRRASADLGLDPRRPADALRILAEADRAREGDR